MNQFPANPLGRSIVFFVALLLFLAGVILAFGDSSASAAVVFGAATLSLIFSMLSQFKQFEGFGIKAEMLDRRMQRLEDVTQHIKDQIDTHPLLVFAGLHPKAQHFVKVAYLKSSSEGKSDFLDEDYAGMREKSPESLDLLGDRLKWFIFTPSGWSFTPDGLKTVGKFIELTIPRLL